VLHVRDWSLLTYLSGVGKLMMYLSLTRSLVPDLIIGMTDIRNTDNQRWLFPVYSLRLYSLHKRALRTDWYAVVCWCS